MEEAADLLIRFVEVETRGTVIDEGKVVDRIRRACEDLKAYYYESVSAQPGQPTDSQSLSNWFWGETRVAWVINRIREICLDGSLGVNVSRGQTLFRLDPDHPLQKETKQEREEKEREVTLRLMNWNETS